MGEQIDWNPHAFIDILLPRDGLDQIADIRHHRRVTAVVKAVQVRHQRIEPDATVGLDQVGARYGHAAA